MAAILEFPVKSHEYNFLASFEQEPFKEFSFDSERKQRSCIIKTKEGILRMHIKGVSEVILEKVLNDRTFI